MATIVQETKAAMAKEEIERKEREEREEARARESLREELAKKEAASETAKAVQEMFERLDKERQKAEEEKGDMNMSDEEEEHKDPGTNAQAGASKQLAFGSYKAALTTDGKRKKQATPTASASSTPMGTPMKHSAKQPKAG